MLKSTFSVLERGPLVNLTNITFPHLASLLRHGTPIPIHGGQGTLFAINLSTNSQFAGRKVEEIFDQFPELLAVAIIRDQRIQLPRGSTRVEGGDQLLIVASETTTIDAFKRLAEARS
jgi:Trk K+ transport system NAD-binding subunit